MSRLPTFLEFLEQMRQASWAGTHAPSIGPPTGHRTEIGGVPVAERKLIPGLGKAVNPARPISPLNSSLLALPGRRRLKSQVMGR